MKISILEKNKHVYINIKWLLANTQKISIDVRCEMNLDNSTQRSF